jgi:hypothetical protein
MAKQQQGEGSKAPPPATEHSGKMQSRSAGRQQAAALPAARSAELRHWVSSRETQTSPGPVAGSWVARVGGLRRRARKKKDA